MKIFIFGGTGFIGSWIVRRLVLEKLPIGRTFTLADDGPCTYVEFANVVAEATGKPHVKQMPPWLARVLLGSVLCEAMTMNQRVKGTRAKTGPRWKLQFPTYREGIPATIAAIEAASAK